MLHHSLLGGLLPVAPHLMCRIHRLTPPEWFQAQLLGGIQAMDEYTGMFKPIVSTSSHLYSTKEKCYQVHGMFPKKV